MRLLKQTAAELTLSANVPVSTLDVSADGAAPPKFDRIDERTFRAKWLHQVPLQMKVGMVARDSQLASRPQPIAIGFKEDRPPRVTLTHSGVGADHAVGNHSPQGRRPRRLCRRPGRAGVQAGAERRRRGAAGGRAAESRRSSAAGPLRRQDAPAGADVRRRSRLGPGIAQARPGGHGEHDGGGDGRLLHRSRRRRARGP